MKWNNADITFNDGVLTVLSDHLDEMISTSSYRKYKINSKISKNKVTLITFKNKTRLPEHPSNIFSNFKNLKTLDLTNVDFKNVKSLSKFITNCPSLEKIYIGSLELNNIKTLTKVISKAENIKFISIYRFKSESLNEIIEPFSYRNHNIELNIKETDLPNLSLLKHTLQALTDSTIKKLNRLNAPNLKELYEQTLNIKKDITIDLSNFKKLSIITLNSKFPNTHLNSIIFPTLKTEFDFIETINMTGYETISNNINKLYIRFYTKCDDVINIPNHIKINEFRYVDEYQNIKINNENHIKQIIKNNKKPYLTSYFIITPLYDNVCDKNVYIKALEDIIKEGDLLNIEKYIHQKSITENISEVQKKKFNVLMNLKENTF